MKQKTFIQINVFIVFNYIIVNMLSNKVLEPIITELLISGTKINLSIAFITQSHFAVSKNVMLKHRKCEESLLFHEIC